MFESKSMKKSKTKPLTMKQHPNKLENPISNHCETMKATIRSQRQIWMRLKGIITLVTFGCLGTIDLEPPSILCDYAQKFEVQNQ